MGQNIALLTYYLGGIGKSERILIFHFENHCVTDFWCGGVLADLLTKDEILDYLRDNKDKKWGLNTSIIYI